MDQTMRFHSFSSSVSVGGQIAPSDLPGLAAAGFAVLVNHRPDGEEIGQPTSADLQSAAAELGLIYVAAPVRGVPDMAALEATDGALARIPAGGKALLFCRSGMRSAAAWAMVESRRGVAPDELRAAAAAAGYDLSRLPL